MKPTTKNQLIETRLQEAFHNLSEIIRDVEESVLSMKVMRRVEYQYSDDGWLGAMKYNGAWRLCHAVDERAKDARPVTGLEGEDTADIGLEWKPLDNAAATDRIEALKYIEGLREAIVESKEDLLVKIEEAIARYQ